MAHRRKSSGIEENGSQTTRLIIPIPTYESTIGIHLQTPKDILRPRDPPILRRPALIRHMDPAAATSRPSAALAAGATAGVSTVATSAAAPARQQHAARAQVRAGGRHHHLGLGDSVGVLVAVLAEDGLQDFEEAGVFAEGVGGWGELGGGADGERGVGGFGGEEGENVTSVGGDGILRYVSGGV